MTKTKKRKYVVIYTWFDNEGYSMTLTSSIFKGIYKMIYRLIFRRKKLKEHLEGLLVGEPESIYPKVEIKKRKELKNGR